MSLVVESGKPPSGNTGVRITDVPRVSMGWLSCTFVGDAALGEYAAYLEAFLGEFWHVPERRWRGYDVTYEAVNGVLMGSKVRSTGQHEVHLDVPARALESMELSVLSAFLEFVSDHAHNVTRLDSALDDYHKHITPLELHALTSDGYELRRDCLVTTAVQSQLVSSCGVRGGTTWYLGAASAAVRLRVYDKGRESGGAIDAIRWEIQLRGVRARDALAQLVDGARRVGCSVAEHMSDWWGPQCVRFVDFRDRSTSSNISRAERLSWWRALVDDARRAVAWTVPAPLTVERMHEYALHALPSWIATLADSAMVRGFSPEEWIRDMVARGRARRSPRHAVALRAFELRI